MGRGTLLWKPHGMDVSIRNMHRKTGIKDVSFHFGYRIWQAAAILFFIISSASVYYLIKDDSRYQTDLIQSYIPCAEMRTITLPDGTMVKLNSESTLLYPLEFKGNTRSVYLVGEANFKVKPDKSHPFIVKSNDFQVTALGTEFQVSAYPNEDKITATLLSGKVKVEYNDLTSSVILNPNEQLFYNKQTKAHQVLQPDMDDETAWQRGELVFSCMDIEDILTRLERKFPYTFVYSFNSLKRDTYSFRFSANATLQEIMDIITQVTDMEYKIEANKCYLLQKKR